MIAKAKMIENLNDVVKYQNAVEEYGSEQEAALHDHYPVKEKLSLTEFYFDIGDVKRAWIQQDGISLDFGNEDIWLIEKGKEVMNKLKERFE